MDASQAGPACSFLWEQATPTARMGRGLPAGMRDEGAVVRSADFAMGTVVTFELGVDGCARSRAARALRRSRALLHRADEVLGTWRPDSPINRLRREEITLAQAPPEVAEVLWCCADARRLSGGWFDPWASAGGVDPAGMVRGWAVGGALDVLRRAGVRAACIHAGSVSAAYGRPAPDQAGLRPDGRGTLLPTTTGETVAVATAPAGGAGAGRPATTVTGPDPALAEALASAVLSAGPDEGLALVSRIPGYGAVIVDGCGATRATPGFVAATAGGGRSRFGPQAA
jgi:FAD:protein FMN transferase